MLANEGMKWVALSGIVGGGGGAKLTQWLVGEGGALSSAMLNPVSNGQ